MLSNGGRFIYSRILIGGYKFDVDCEGRRVDERFQLNAFFSAQYVHGLPLSYNGVIMEERSNRKMDYNWNQLRLTTAEMSLGFEFYYKFTEVVRWKSYFGACVYDHLNYLEGMCQEKTCLVLTVGTGICIRNF
jgi:hypothetical protein